MTEWTSIRVSKDAKAKAEESKGEDETWNEYLKRCTDNPPEVREFVQSEQLVTDEMTELLERMGKLESMMREATDAAQSAERKVESLTEVR